MKICIAEYKCIIDESGNTFGHGKKVLYEAEQMCRKMGFERSVATCESYRDKGYDGEYILLPNAIHASDYTYHSIKRVMENIKTVVKKTDADYIWFTNVDWYLFMYLGCHKIKQKVIITAYADVNDSVKYFSCRGVPGKLVASMEKRGIRKLSLIMETFYRDKRSANAMYMPDYLYTDFYKKYRAVEKKHRVICIGTMNTQKDVKGAVALFSQMDIPFFIVGGFVDEKLYEELCEKSTDNIQIKDAYLSDEEYYNELASSEYVIVPYDMSVYGSATSGVVREAIYMGVKVIAPQKLLDNMGIKLKGYEKLQKVKKLIESDSLSVYPEKDLEQYSEERLVKEMKERLSEI